MNYAKAFNVVQAGQGHGGVQHHGTQLIAGQIWQTNDGCDLMQWPDHPISHFDFVDNAIHCLLKPVLNRSLRREGR